MVTGPTRTPTVSVVVPLYNKERHIRRALDSILAQTMQDFEIVVVDDGSTDGGGAVVERIADPRVRSLRQANAGVSVARNRAIAESRAELVAFCDADDAWRPDFLANILELRDAYPAAGAFAQNYDVVSPGGVRGLGVPASTPRQLLDPDGFFRIAKHGTPVFSSSVAVSKSSFDRAGAFPPGVKLGEDLDTWLRICFASPIAYDPRPGGCYFQDAGLRACTINPPPERYVFFDTIDRWIAECRTVPMAVLDDIREFKNSFVLVYARHQIRFGDPREGRRALMECRTREFMLQKWKWMLASFLPQEVQSRVAGLKQPVRTS